MGKARKKSKHISTGNDFKKLKLKAGKKKPSVNATVTSFKSKSIYISEQLKTQSTDEVLSYTKQSLPELLSHLNHYSANFRCRALTGIKEIMLQDSKSKTVDPGSIVQKISKFIIDDDSEVRKTCISLLQLLFASMPEKNMSPHFPLLLSHLYCAMSHISLQVQRHSLKVVELFLKFYPNLIHFHSQTKLLQYFIELISVRENSTNSSGRVLSTTFAMKKETVIQWRVRVLSQVLSLLQINSQSSNSNVDQEEQTCFWNSQNLVLKLIPCIPKQRGICLENIQRTSVVSSNEPTKKELMITTVPILLQCWVEVSASGILEKELETVQTMINVLSITYLFCNDLYNEAEDKTAQVAWLRKNYYSLFVKHFFNKFPFELPETFGCTIDQKGRKTSTETVKKSDFQLINVLVCELCALLSSNQHFAKDVNIVHAALNYLSNFLKSCLRSTFVDSHIIDLVLSSLKRIFCLEKIQGDCDMVLSNLYKYCCSGKCARLNRCKIIHFMMDLYANYTSLQRNCSFEKLLADLPTHFISVSQDFAAKDSKTCKLILKDSLIDYLNSILRCMQCALRRKNVKFLKSASKNLALLVKTMNRNHKALFCASENDCIDCIQFQNWTFGCLLPQLPSTSEADFTALASYCCNQRVHVQNKTFIIDTLVQKILLGDQAGFTRFDKKEVNFFLKFLFTVLLVTCEESSRSESTSNISDHESVCDHICNSLKQLSQYWPDLWKVQNAFFERKLKRLRCFHVLEDNGEASAYSNNLSIPREPMEIKRHNTMDKVLFQCMSTTVKNETILGLLKLGCSLAEQKQVEVDLRGIGRFLAAYSILCHKQSKEYDEIVHACIVVLLRVIAIMEPYVRILIKSDSSSSVNSLINLLEITDLRESYVTFSSDLILYVEALEKAGEDPSKEIRKLKSLTSALCAVH